jgi:trimethylamine--corrinoid protein Co-methyltransferase
VVDEEIAELCQRVRDGVDTSDAKDFCADIEAVRPGGDFFSRENTLQACRSDEFLAPRLCDRNVYERWTELGSPDIYDTAHQRVEEILATPQRHPLPGDVIDALEAIIRRAEAEL